MYTPRWLLEFLVWLLLLLLHLQIIVVNGWNLRYITGLLMPFKQMIELQEIVWFISPELSMEHTDEADQFIRILGDFYGITQTVVHSNSSDMRMIRSAAKRNHMSIVFPTGPGDPIMDVVNKVLLGRHYYFIIFMLMDKIGEMESVYELCHFLYDYQYENSLIYFESTDGRNQLFGTNRYPVLQIENRTDILRFFKSKSKQILNGQDVEGFRFPTPLRQDPPHLFQVSGSYEGSTYRIIETFVRYVNGSFAELELPKDPLGGQVVNMRQILELVRRRRIEFSAHAYALFRSDDELDKSYPLLVVRWCLMVPLYNKVSTYLYAVQPFDAIVWFFVLGSFLALILLELLWLWLAVDNAGGAPIVALLNSFCYIINIATGRQLLQPSMLRFLLLIAVFFHGFFLSANYTSTLGSILTVNLFQSQLNTMEDLLQAQLPVMIIDYELDFLLELHSDLLPEFRSLLRPVDSAIYAQHQFGFNNSFAYFVTEDKWQFLNEQQRHLKQRQFKLSDICFGSFHLAYPMQMDSSLWRDLEYYTFRVHSSGLHNYYARISFEAALRARLVQRLTESQEFTSAGLQHLTIAFIFLGVMTTIAAIIFGFELFWTRILLNNRNTFIV